MKALQVDYVVEENETVTLDIARDGGLLAGHDLMSPYVWEDSGVKHLLVRVLNNPLQAGDPTGVIYAGTSKDGLSFTMLDKPAILPGPEEVDAGGVEDPTVVVADSGGLLVFFTGVDAKHGQGSLLVAKGADLGSLKTQKVLLKAPEGEGNIKEATVAQAADGRYRLFYEYAKDNASRIGLALSDAPEGPWQAIADPFTVREDRWDNWHLSTGPIVARKGQPPVMFYNGATADARWRIGWIAFDENYTRVVDRCVEPMLVPPPPQERAGTDIAFAASCLDDGKTIYLYYSLEDRMLRRARIRRFVNT
ncbi:glycosidase [Novosphingobium sp. G106]|uniref:glycosidase n=1 Tax=Novosphingobium sp. G106 TaxID=2849500 RepID=UPI001C2CE80C|nr:glycosidase [Novosphingobium sp. G106]MBV1689155.1 glycosidase [Novosphingobium sp. G106]